MRRAAVAIVLTAAFAGCGGSGDSGQKADLTPTQRRAELDRWVERADGVCRKGNEAIAGRGWPTDLVELDKLAVRAVDDVREASRSIQGLAPPKGSEDRVKPFVASLKSLDGLLDDVTDTTGEYRPRKLNSLAPDLRSGLLEVEQASKDLGLRECAANDEHTWVPDAMRAPVYAQQLAGLDRRVAKRAKAVAEPVSSPADASRNLDRLSDVVTMADRGLSKLKPPLWAATQAGRYVKALRNLTGVLDEGARKFSGGLVTYEVYTAFRKKLNGSLAIERKRFKQLYKAIGALPTARGRKGGEEPAGDDTEAA